MNGGAIRHRADISVLDTDVEPLLLGEVKELIINVMGVRNVLLKTNYSKALKSLWLVDHRIKAVRIVERSCICRVCIWTVS